MAASVLPHDTTLFAVNRGALLLSRDFVHFCHIPAEQVGLVRQVIAGQLALAELPESLLTALREHGFEAGPRPCAPTTHSVQLQLTNECNLRCAYCCTDSGQARPGEVTLSELVRVVDEARATFGKGTHFGILGGEPLLVDWAIVLAEYIVAQGSSLTLFSNGTLLANGTAQANERLCDRLASIMRQGAELRISLAGVTPALCDSLSGAARFERALDAIQALSARGVMPQVDVMLLPQHIDALTENLPKLRKRLPQGIPLSFGILYRSGRERGRHLFGSRRALEQALDRIVFEAGETIRATGKSPVAQRREGCSCALGHHLHVRSDGRLFSCFKLDEPVGDLRQQSFASVAAAAASRARPASSLRECADCQLNTLCGGGCRSENLRFTGNPDRPVCGQWRKRVCHELLAEDLPAALEWPVEHLLAEAHDRAIDAPTLDELFGARLLGAHSIAMCAGK